MAWDWSIDRRQVDEAKKDPLMDRLVEESDGRCRDCGEEFPDEILQMHRLDQSLACDKTFNFGYTRQNVVLV